MATLKENYIKIIMTIISVLLAMNAYFVQDLVAGLKEADQALDKKIIAADARLTGKSELLFKAVEANKHSIGLSEKDISYIIKTLDEIKEEVKKK